MYVDLLVRLRAAARSAHCDPVTTDTIKISYLQNRALVGKAATAVQDVGAVLDGVQVAYVGAAVLHGRCVGWWLALLACFHCMISAGCVNNLWPFSQKLGLGGHKV